MPATGLRRLLTTLLPFVVVLMPAGAQATDCKLIDGATPELAVKSAEERLAWLDQRLQLDGQHALVWSSLWGAAYLGLTAGQWALWPTAHSRVDKVEKIVGSSASFIGVLSVAALPPRATLDAHWWKRHRQMYPNEDVCSLLNEAEQLLMRDADDDEFGSGPLVHLGNFIVNIAAGLILGLGYNDWRAWGYTTVVGIVVGEVQTATRPNESREDLDRYRRGHFARTEKGGLHWGITPAIPPKGAGLLFGLHF